MQDHDSAPTQQTTPESRTARPVPKGIVAGLAAVVLAVGGGVAWWTWHSFQSQNAVPEAATPQPSASTPSDLSQAPIEQTVQVYWLKTVGNGFELAPASVNVSVPGQPDALLKAAFEEMLKGSSNPDLTSTIPQGTQLRSVAVKNDGVHVDLSQPFTSGGGSTAMTGRLGQVIYTATTLDPNVSVWIAVEGQPLEVLGGEGLVVDQPMTRASFEKNFPL